MSGRVNPIPDGYRGAIPYPTVRDVARALEFYRTVFGAQEVSRLTDPASGKVVHAEIRIEGSVIMLAEEVPEWGNLSPLSLGGAATKIVLYVENVDAVAQQAVAAGGKLLTPVADQFYGDRSARIEDPFGHVWLISTHKEDVSPEEIRRRLDAQMKQPGGS
jgi:PhnB protein